MGWEYSLTVESQQYEQLIDSLYCNVVNAKLEFPIQKTSNGFSLICDDPKWPDLVMFQIDTAGKYHILPEGTPYIYCIFYISGKDAEQIINIITETAKSFGDYVFEDM